MTFKTLDEMKGKTMLEVLEAIGNNSSIEHGDEQIAYYFASKFGFKYAKVTCGIMYLQPGEQPMGVNQFCAFVADKLKVESQASVK